MVDSVSSGSFEDMADTVVETEKLDEQFPEANARRAKTVILELFQALQRENVRYCHWKSNVRLHEALAGQDDVDILVGREDAGKLCQVLLSLGFKLAVARNGLDHPGVFHALGLDRTSGEIVHVHAYTQIVTGDSLVKSYRLPIEDFLLDDTSYIEGVRVPAAEVELALFVVRVALKHLSIVEILMANRDYGSVVHELGWLRDRADIKRASVICEKMFPGIEEELFRELLDATGKKGALIRRVWLAQAVAQQLAQRRRLGRARATLARLWRVGTLVAGRLGGRKTLQLGSGGALIAFVGPKASGKSTLAGALAQRLGVHLDVETIHAGKPPPTAVTFVPRLLIPLARHWFRSERPSEYERPERRAQRHYSFLYVLRMTMAAYDRQRLLSRSMRKAGSGRIVISDRFPADFAGAIDSSVFDNDAVTSCRSSLKRQLMRLERRYYRSLPRPDLIVRLEVPLEATIQRDSQREKDEGPDAEALKRRWHLETQAYSSGSRVARVNTSGALEATIGSVVSVVWEKV